MNPEGLLAETERGHAPLPEQPDTPVDFEAGLIAAVRRLREALDDSADAPRYVETLPRRGYRFVATVDGARPAAALAPAASAGADVSVVTPPEGAQAFGR